MFTMNYRPKLVQENTAKIALTSQILYHNHSCKAIVSHKVSLYQQRYTLNNVFKLFLFSLLKMGWQLCEDITDVFFHIMEWLCW